MTARMAGFSPGTGPRWSLGLAVASSCDRVDAALVADSPGQAGSPPEVVAIGRCEIPGSVAALYRQLISSPATDHPSPGTIGRLRRHLAEVQVGLIEHVTDQARVARNRILCAGVHDPGLWSGGNHLPVTYLGLCDGAFLAEASGLNVVDAFPARDLALGGLGGPITALSEWILLHEPLRNRLLLHLGNTTRLSYLPAARHRSATAEILAFDVGPGTRLLDILAQRLTRGEKAFDPGGRLAVQGHKIVPLLEQWLADPYFDRPLPRWSPRGLPPERFLTGAFQLALAHDWSVRDLLCTATHLVAEAVTRAVRRTFLPEARIDEVVLAGGGQHNGMLLREIAAGLGDIPMVRSAEAGVPSDALDAASAAVLALLHVDREPANLPAVSGSDARCVLGRLTPGSPQNWQRLLQHITLTNPALRPQRAAL